MTSPLELPVANVLHGGAPETITQTGPAPERIGLEMIGIEKGAPLTVTAQLVPLGEGVLVDAEVEGPMSGTCSRCLDPLKKTAKVHVKEVFAASDDFIASNEEDEDDDYEPPRVEGDSVNLLQSVIDEAGVTWPFSPTCEFTGQPCDYQEEKILKEKPTDPRWAGLADKLKELDE